jgi:hypothetical protein
MAYESQLLGFPELRYVECQTSRTVRAGTLVKMAAAASQVATQRPAKGVRVDNLTPGTYRVSFTRTSRDINLLYLAWFYRATLVGAGTDTLSVALTITDGTNTIVSSDPRIPYAFQGTSTLTTIAAAALANPSGSSTGGEGWLDLDALAGALTASDDWVFEFVVTRTGTTAYVDRVEGFEVPRSIVRAGAAPDDDAAGALMGPFNPGNPITAGTTDTVGLLRLEQTLQAAVARCTPYLSLAWPCDITAAIPQTTSGTFATFINLKETGTTNPVPFTVRILPKYVAAAPGTAAGERGRFRVLFYVAGGGTAQVRLTTGSTTNTYDATGLTGANWQWSPWVDCELPTDAAGQVATLTLQGLTSAGTLYLAGALVEERAA